MSDRVLGGTCLVLALLYILFATQIRVGFISDPMGPKVFPIVIGVALALGSLYVLFRPDPEPLWPAFGRVGEIALAVLVMVLYTYALPHVGFTISTTFAAGILSWRLGASPLAASIAGVVIAVSIFVIFRTILGLSLALGPMGF